MLHILILNNLQTQVAARKANLEQRVTWHADVLEEYPADTLVFVDETGCNKLTAKRRKGWAPSGERARRRDFFIRGQRCVPCCLSQTKY
jgi:hypothetical protein